MPAPKAKDVTVNVTLNSEKPGDFKIEPSPNGALPTGPDGELIFRNAGHPGFFVVFHLIDLTHQKYGFPPNSEKKAAVWSTLKANACPGEPGEWAVFEPISVSPDGMNLKVHNANVAPIVGLFSYTLRVTKDGGTKYLDLDPGGSNQNGPIGFVSPKPYVAFIVGAIVGALAILGGQALLGR